jgi:hypothetical protein
MARGPGSAKNLDISPDQPSEKAAERGFCFEILFRIFLEDPDATLSAEVIGLAFIRAHQGLWISPGNLHAAYGIHNFFLRICSHDFSLCFKKYDS